MSKRTRIDINSSSKTDIAQKKTRLWDDSLVITEDDWDTELVIPPRDDEYAPTDSDSDSENNSEQRYLDSISPKEKKMLLDEEKRLNSLMKHNIPLKYKILRLSAPDSVKLNALKMLKHYNNDNENGAGFLTAVENITSIPWNVYHQLPVTISNASPFLVNSYSLMDKAIYGQHAAKMEVIEFLATLIANPNSNRVIGLYGPPGIGKTSLVKKALSEALGNRPFHYVSLGGAMDATFLTGSRPVWKGSRSSRLVNAVIDCGCMNPIIYFDELDKISKTEKGDEIIDFLVHLTDPIQNDHINDKFTGIDLDLSKAIIVFSYNYREKIDSVLLDRIKEIELFGFNEKEKVHIARDYIIPKTLHNVGFKQEHKIIINEPEIHTINALVSVENETSGVRNLIRVYKDLFSRLMVCYMTQDVHQRKRKRGMSAPINSLIRYSLDEPIKFPFVLSDHVIKKLLL